MAKVSKTLGTVVTFVLVVLGIAIAWSILRRSGIPKDLAGLAGLVGDVYGGGISGSISGPGKGVAGPASSPIAGAPAVAAAATPTPIFDSGPISASNKPAGVASPSQLLTPATSPVAVVAGPAPQSFVAAPASILPQTPDAARALVSRVQTEVNAGKVPSGVFRVSNDPAVGNVAAGVGGAPVYLVDTAAQLATAGKATILANVARDLAAGIITPARAAEIRSSIGA